jgi:hypothetical protein
MAALTLPCSKEDHIEVLRDTYEFSHARGDYRASARPSKAKIKRLRATVKCASPRWQERREARVERRRMNWRFHRHIDRITRFGKYSIPSYIVFRESRYRARAKNSISSAGGYYQILNTTWAAFGGRRNGCYHVAACAPIWEQHTVASRIWADGSHHWALTR